MSDNERLRHLETLERPPCVVGTLAGLTYATANLAAGATIDGTIYLSPANYPVNANYTVPANVHLVIPKGSYFTVANATILTVNATVEAGLWQIFSLIGTAVVTLNATREVYPQWFGTTSTAGIQEATDALSTGGGRVFIPGNTVYTLTDQITIAQSNMAFVSVGMGARIEMTVADLPIFYATGLTSLKFIGLYLRGKSDEFDPGWLGAQFDNGIWLDNCSRVEIRGCIIRGVAYDGIFLNGCASATIDGNIIEGTGAIEGNISGGDNFQFGIQTYLDTDENIVISNNDISHLCAGIQTAFADGMTISGNVIHDIDGQHGMYLHGSNFSVTGNVVKNTYRDGIKIQDANDTIRNFVISGNTIRDTGAQGILVNVPGTGAIRDVVISDNSLYDTETGIEVAGDGGIVVISGNVIDTIDKNGIRLSERLGGGSPSIVRIVDNIIIDPGAIQQAGNQHGIKVEVGADVSIVGNRVADVRGVPLMEYGVYVAGDSGFRVINNKISNATGQDFRTDVAIDEWLGNEVGDRSIHTQRWLRYSQGFEYQHQSIIAADVVLWEMELDDESAYVFTARITGKLAGSAERAAYVETGLFYRDGAGAVQEGAIDTDVSIASGGFAGAHSWDVVANRVRILVNSGGAAVYDWNVRVTYSEVVG